MRRSHLTRGQDNCHKLLSLIIYLPTNFSPEAGTALYEPMAEARVQSTRCGEQAFTFDGYREVSRVPYLVNTLFAFAPCQTSWHGVPKAQVPRRALFAWLKLADASKRVEQAACHARGPPGA